MTSTKRLLIVFLLLSSTAFGQNAALKNPSSLKERAPAVYRVKFDTSAGVFEVEVHTDWAPNGADRFYNLVKNGFYDNCRFYRVVSNFMVQFGMHGDPSVNRVWAAARIPADRVTQGNNRGMMTFAMAAAPDTRTTQVFINFKDNSGLNRQGFAPFGKIVSGMDVVDKIYGGYGDGPPKGRGPAQDRITAEGNAYLTKNFPRLDYIKKATIEK